MQGGKVVDGHIYKVFGSSMRRGSVGYSVEIKHARYLDRLFNVVDGHARWLGMPCNVEIFHASCLARSCHVEICCKLLGTTCDVDGKHARWWSTHQGEEPPIQGARVQP
ncbi:unnamed protein product [Prunus armeniaca]|uniref:Uncharacterized protein n=1 Tax=Prunus armeniaca TaxID=36596 RepID=A0A6J5XLZ2_PRUAR|nr:hypothetical protein GBA52_027197 [Prunus armeniaca]CAB4282966.1 unnamed protein product [Prunus armeniaca]CAB4313393.1 unnamed protein product [Prunus armeniaca]